MTDQPALAQRRADIRSSLGQAHSAFHELLTSLSNEHLSLRARSGWCARDVATHMVISIERVPALIEALRRGHDYLNFPSPVFERLRGLHLGGQPAVFHGALWRAAWMPHTRQFLRSSKRFGTTSGDGPVTHIVRGFGRSSPR